MFPPGDIGSVHIPRQEVRRRHHEGKKIDFEGKKMIRRSQIGKKQEAHSVQTGVMGKKGIGSDEERDLDQQSRQASKGVYGMIAVSSIDLIDVQIALIPFVHALKLVDLRFHRQLHVPFLLLEPFHDEGEWKHDRADDKAQEHKGNSRTGNKPFKPREDDTDQQLEWLEKDSVQHELIVPPRERLSRRKRGYRFATAQSILYMVLEHHIHEFASQMFNSLFANDKKFLSALNIKSHVL